MSLKKHIVLYAADIHGSVSLYEAIFDKAAQENVNSLVIGGDILPKSPAGNMIELQREFLKTQFIPMFKKFKEENPSTNIFVMMGNDDFKINLPYLEEGEQKEYFRLLDMKVHKLNSQFNICGYSHVSPLPFLMKDWQKH
ncbi:MAG: metallophosphoesterase, partial [Candidatus Marinimicrobia bacterium]|nr:metallophosphoesterase [Candidatus Neomarinimicrobiota bacterium]